MEQLILIADKYGIAGFFILVLCVALNKQFGFFTKSNEKESDSHEAERKQWHEDLKENTKAVNELRANLGTFCGDRRRRNDTEN
ncbi:MAG: hypothetical protein WCK96_12220 [Methylococcales bacterium]